MIRRARARAAMGVAGLTLLVAGVVLSIAGAGANTVPAASVSCTTITARFANFSPDEKPISIDTNGVVTSFTFVGPNASYSAPRPAGATTVVLSWPKEGSFGPVTVSAAAGEDSTDAPCQQSSTTTTDGCGEACVTTTVPACSTDCVPVTTVRVPRTTAPPTTTPPTTAPSTSTPTTQPPTPPTTQPPMPNTGIGHLGDKLALVGLLCVTGIVLLFLAAYRRPTR